MISNEDKKQTAYEMYKNKKHSFKEIAAELEVKESTLNNWRHRYKWVELSANIERQKLYELLLSKLKDKGLESEMQFVDMVNTYMNFFDIKNKLIEDIEERGVSVMGVTGSVKKNDSISELTKVITSMSKLLEFLGIDIEETEDDEELDI
ncbi:terminase gpP N-terminus-related DNA-binding protein [Bacillus cereus]|uniref:terminase gpP N-terminus-related DNA-binding protein n=1 Tax=Bacillus cereus TaxID=1396 RepID=UPI003012DE20